MMRIELSSKATSLSTNSLFLVFTKDAIQVVSDKGNLLITPESFLCKDRKICSTIHKDNNKLYTHWEHELPVGNLLLVTGVWQGKITESHCYYILIYSEPSEHPVSFVEVGQFAGTYHADIQQEKTVEKVLLQILQHRRKETNADYRE